MERYPQVFPIYLVVAAFFAFRCGEWGAFAREKKCLLLAPFLIMFTLPLLGGWWKYMVPYLPILIILASRGLVNIAAAISERFSGVKNLDLGKAFLLLATILIVVRFVVALQPPKNGKPTENAAWRATYNQEVVRVGAWMSQRFEPGKNYMIQWSRLIYYLNGLWTPDPLAETDAILKFAKMSGVDYIVKEIFDPNMSLQDIKNTPPGVKFTDIYVSKDGAYKVAFFQLIK
jgi:hypothetical protein